MRNALFVYKPQGKTPLEMVQKVKSFPEYKNQTISYAGRLDPMAEGVLVILVGEENKKRRIYEEERKTYRVEVLLGIETDTYDALGIPLVFPHTLFIDKEKIIKTLQTFKGKFLQEYPPYSSRTVKGKPLYWWARQGRLSEITIPVREVEIYSIQLNSLRTISAHSLLKRVLSETDRVKGDFRQSVIKKNWEEKLKAKDTIFQVVEITVECSSGTYMRSLAHNVGKKLFISALALRIIREKVGNIGIKDCISL